MQYNTCTYNAGIVNPRIEREARAVARGRWCGGAKRRHEWDNVSQDASKQVSKSSTSSLLVLRWERVEKWLVLSTSRSLSSRLSTTSDGFHVWRRGLTTAVSGSSPATVAVVTASWHRTMQYMLEQRHQNCHQRSAHRTYHIYSHTSRIIWNSFAPSKSGGSTYMRVTVCQHMCHKFFHKADDVSWAWD